MPDEISWSLSQPGALDGATTLVLGVSGGADSVALLHALRRVHRAFGLTIVVATLNHGMRGAAGQSDLDFVAELARKWGFACRAGSADVMRLGREWGMGMEAAARRARYVFLAQVAQQSDAKRVAVAHHADDQAETLLLHIARGSGLRGLQGMRPASPMPYAPQIRLLRPLLGVTRADIEAYCAARNLRYQVDESNQDTRHTRNFIRAEVMPRLKRVNPAIAPALGRLAENAVTDADFIAQQFESLALPLVARSDCAWQIDKAGYGALHAALRRRLLRRAFAALGGGEIALEQVIALDGWAMGARVGKWRDMGAGLRLRCDYDRLAIEKRDARQDAGDFRLIPADCDMPLQADTVFSAFGLEIRVLPHAAGIGKRGIVVAADADLRLRTRRAGDRFKPRGMGGRSRKLKDYFIDRKVPRALRSRIPLLCADGDIVAICLAGRWHLAESANCHAARRIVAVLD